MKKNLYRITKITLPQNEFKNSKISFTLEYFILEKEVVIPNENISTVIYGVEIIKIYFSDYGKLIKESEKVEDVCCSEKKIKEIVDVLCHNSVTPMCLLEVLEDMTQSENIYIDKKPDEKRVFCA